MSRILFLLADDFEDSEFSVPYERLCADGHDCVVAGTERGRTVVGKRGDAKYTLDAATSGIEPDDFDAVVLPGGYSPDKLRTDEAAVELVRKLDAADRPVAAICHAGSLLIEADTVDGRTVTSWPSIRTDLVNAGATWVDKPVVVDQNLVTARKPADLDAFVSETRRLLDDADAD